MIIEKKIHVARIPKIKLKATSPGELNSVQIRTMGTVRNAKVMNINGNVPGQFHFFQLMHRLS